ncbi:NAD(P)-binding protein [Cadophora sp. DSE1049]|nr:NAD(P)-binding protein [Cadophora sp. DSE1049]
MPPIIKSVAVAGATGNTGPTVVKTLVDSGFKVTALTRSASKTDTLSGLDVKIVEVDYLSHESLVSALQGIDAVVVCGVGMLPEQTNLIDASIASSVRHFLPADFASDLETPAKRSMRVHRDKVATLNYLQARQSSISYTCIHTGPLLDYLLNIGVLVNVKSRSITLFDDGEKRFSTTTMGTAAKAIVAVLKHPEKFANREVRVHDVVTSQNQLLRLAKEIVPDEEWSVTGMDTGDCEGRAREAFKADPDSRMGIQMEKVVGVFGRDHGSDFGEADNVELGIQVMTEEQLKEVLGRFA